MRVLSSAGCMHYTMRVHVQVRTASLNFSMVGAVAILIGNEFHVVIVCGKKLYFRVFVLHWYGM